MQPQPQRLENVPVSGAADLAHGRLGDIDFSLASGTDYGGHLGLAPGPQGAAATGTLEFSFPYHDAYLLSILS